MKKEIRKSWNKTAKDLLEGRTIKSVRYLTEKESEKMDWTDSPVIITLDNGVQIIPSSDDEGNNGGALFVGEETLPVISRELKYSKHSTKSLI